MTLSTLIAELEEALKAAKLTGDKWTVGYTNIGPDDNTRLIAFLYDGDEESGPIICVDEEPNGDDLPSPALHLIALMRNSLPTLLEALKRQREALEIYDKCADDCINHAMFSDKQAVVDAIERAHRSSRTALTAHKEKSDV